jgi:glycosyltransferase involved in cell wall biosynthesis
MKGRRSPADENPRCVEDSSPLTVSVVIPAYNIEEYVHDAVESALNQTYPLEEIVCVDDGSTDETLEVLRDLEAQHPEQIHVLTGPNRGACAARNRGMERATGEYIQFLDADDVLLSEKVERDVAVLEENREALLFGGYESYENGEKIYESDAFMSKDPWVCLAVQNSGQTSSNLFRADAVEQVGGWDEQRPFNQDYDLVARMLMDGADVVFAPQRYTHARNREGSISDGWGTEMRSARAEIDRDILRYLRSIDADEESISTIEEGVFLRLRQLYQLDPEAAVRLYHETFPDGYEPTVGTGNTKAYCTVHRLLGFSAAERIRAQFHRWRQVVSLTGF